MRLLFVARRYWPAVGGVESYLRHVAVELAARHEVTVLAQRIDDGPGGRLDDSLSPPPTFEAFTDQNVLVEPLRIPFARRALLAPLISQVTPGLRRYAYGRMRAGAAMLYRPSVAPVIERRLRSHDVVHMWGGDLLATAVMRAARRRGVPGVVTPFAHQGQWGDDVASGGAYRAATRVVALLDAEADVYRKLGVPEARIAVSGVGSPGVRTGGGDALRRRLRIDGPLVVFLGVRRPYKGFDLLLEAAPLVANDRPDTTFAFVGPGDPIVASAGVRVVDAGPVTEIERAAWLEAADLLCLPSHGEIFPVSILEAWSAGTAVVTSDLPTLVELVEGSGGGVTVRREPRALADAILALLADPDRRRVLAERGRERWQERYTVEAVAAWHERLYAELSAERVSCAA